MQQALLLPAWLASIAFTTFVLLSTEKWGSGTHVWDVPIPLFEPLAMAGWASEVTFMISTGCTKCSILFFYRRLTKGTYNRKWEWAIIAAIVITIGYTIAFVVVLIFVCSPTEAYWRSKNPSYGREYTCHDTRDGNAISGIVSVISDFYSVLLPCLMLWKFEAPRKQKIALNIIFCLGLLVTAAGSVRTYYLHQLGHSADLTYAGFNVFIWAQLEVQLAIICASAPALRVFFRTYLSDPMVRVFSSVRSRSRHDSENMDTELDGVSSTREGSPIPFNQMSVVNREKYVHMTEVDKDSESNDALGRRDTDETDWEREFKDLEASRPAPAHLMGKE